MMYEIGKLTAVTWKMNLDRLSPFRQSVGSRRKASCSISTGTNFSRQVSICCWMNGAIILIYI